MARKILYYTDSTETGGAELALLQIIDGLDRSAWSPVLAFPPLPGLARLSRLARAKSVPVFQVPRLPLGLAGAQELPEFIRFLKEQQPDVFHASLSWPLACKWGLAAAVLCRIPAIFATEQLYVEAEYSHFSIWQQRWIARGVDAYLPVSEGTAARLKEVFGLPPEKVRVIKNAVRKELLEPVAVSNLAASAVENPVFADKVGGSLGTQLGNSNNGSTPDDERKEHPLILTLARLVPQKGLDDLVKAAALLPDVQFMVLGEGPERAALEGQIQSLGIGDRFRLAGQVEDVPELLSRCDLFVLPSLYEGLPLSILEAMAAGKPVLATDIPGTREVVKHGQTGWLVAPGNPVELAKAIQTLLNDPALSTRLAQAGQALVRAEYSSQHLVEEIERIYTQTLAKKGKVKA